MDIREFFPLIRQNIRDVYNADCHLLEAPFTDFNVIDRGFRKMVWGNYNTDVSDFFNPTESKIVVIKSTLRFVNVLAIFASESGFDKLISIGPFREEEVTSAFMEEVVTDNLLKVKDIDMLRNFYTSIPKLQAENVVVTFRHLLEFADPYFHKIEPDYLLFTENENKIELDVNMLGQYTAEHAELYIQILNELLSAVSGGNVSSAFDAYKTFAETVMRTEMETYSVVILQKILTVLNALFSVELSRNYVHPYYCRQLHQNMENAIAHCGSVSACRRLPYDMIHKYCLLIKNHHHAGYSYLIKNVVDYIVLHPEENLTLSVLAQRFGKNPSYLSKQFHEETGMSLTAFVQSERIRMAVKLFNTTQMSVSDVAMQVGISDFAYFSKQFKKQIGVSPREYCLKIRVKNEK